MDSQPTTGYRWLLPSSNHSSDQSKHQLRILNSFTRKKDLFVPNSSKSIKWYSCGPTVYDVAHLGHARCYITFDIMRRILSDYFGFHVFYVMNITDIDDKIIKRARSNHLCDQFIEKSIESHTGAAGDTTHLIKEQLEEALVNFKKRRADETDPAKLEMVNNIVKVSEQAILDLAHIGSKKSTDPVPSAAHELRKCLTSLRDVIADEQDSKLAHTVHDHQIFKELTMRYEQEYHQDMNKLDVLPPSALTRVSEYIDEIGCYLKKLEANGFAYRTGGSVYFDTDKFESDPKHSYAKLVREAFGQKKSLDEGEGELTLAGQDAKKSPNDFALWKKSKVGEPSWTTQDYDAGRPGWHIECSVMASHLLGENFDLHSGGCDLKFPHHDNEIAQAEAYYNTGKNWVNYFVHSGHLTISGCKMSKSLKNFITIRQALTDYSSRQLRFAFLAHGWSETLDYSPNTMNTATSYEKTFKEFFYNVNDALRRRANKATSNAPDSSDVRFCDYFQKWSVDDQQLNQEFINATDKVDVALCDNFDTRSALNILSALVKECNKRPNADSILLQDIASFIWHILSIFGARFDDIPLESLFPLKGSVSSGQNSSTNMAGGLKFVETLAQFRSDIRRISKLGEPQKSIKEILALCDTLRDQTLPNLGVRLEDKEIDGATYVVKFVDKETLAREKALAEKKEQEKLLREETTKLEKLKLQQQREEKMKIAPKDMFRNQLDKYSKFDDNGMPTHDTSGKEISKSALKKLQRLYTEQEARYNKFISEQTISK